MRKGWEYKKLGEICSSDLGKTLNKSKDVGNMHPYLCAINILWDFIDLTTLKETCFKDDEIDRYTVKYGDLLVCEGGDTGRAAIWDREEPILYQNALHRLRFKEDIDARFIMYNLWHKKQIGEIDNKYSKGVTILHLVKSALLSIPILLPPLSTQLSIVSELDKINELIRLKKEQLKDFDNLAQSIFYEMFGDPVENERGWDVKKIKDIATEKLSYGSGASAVPFNTSVRYIRITDINEYGELKDEKVSPNIFDEKYLLAEGDILFARSGATVGKTYLHKKNENPCIYAGYLIRLRPNEMIVLPYYVYYYTKSNYYKSFICANQRVVAQPNINAKQYGNLDIPLPPLPLQQLFAQRIEQIEHQKAEVQKSIMDLETLLASRMQYWFE